MAKKQFGKIAALAVLAGAAAGITYFLRYKSFHEELEEDFHDFEDDLDEFDAKEEETKADREAPKRNYVSLTPEKAGGDVCASREETEERSEAAGGAQADSKSLDENGRKPGDPALFGSGAGQEDGGQPKETNRPDSAAGTASEAGAAANGGGELSNSAPGGGNGLNGSHEDGSASTTIVEDEDAAQ